MAEVDHYAVFADIMGFAASLEQLTSAEHSSLENSFKHSRIQKDSTERVRAMVLRYWRFHRELTDRTRSTAISYVSDVEAVITFADSGYLVTSSFAEASEFAWHMMRKCWNYAIPMRIGIGRGSFTRLAFAAVNHPDGRLVADAPFLGTAIVRAYKATDAKSCPGFRILIHPSAKQIAGSMRCEELLVDEQSDDCVQEVDFITDPLTNTPGCGTAEEQILEHLDRMRHSVSDTRAIRHYVATEKTAKRLCARRPLSAPPEMF